MAPWVLDYGSALLVIALIMWLSDVVGTATKAKIPGTFMLSLFLLVGWWTVLPKDIMKTSTIDALSNFVRYYIMVQIGSLFDWKEFVSEWKTVVTTLAAVAGLMVVTLGISSYVIGKQEAFVMAAPLAGGVMAMMLMGDAATALGRSDLATLAVLTCVMQGFLGMPGASYCLTKAGKPMLEQFRAGTFKGEIKQDESTAAPKLVEKIPQKYRSTNYYIVSLIFFTMVSVWLAQLFAKIGLGRYITPSITGIIVGIGASAFGLLEKDAQGKAQMSGFSNFVLMPALLVSLRNATPQLIIQLMFPLVVGLLISVIGVALSIPVGKKVGYNKFIAMACGLNCYLGFPPNYYVTVESVNALTDDPKERKFLMDQLLPKMILGSVTAVSIVSVIIAGAMAPLLK